MTDVAHGLGGAGRERRVGGVVGRADLWWGGVKGGGGDVKKTMWLSAASVEARRTPRRIRRTCRRSCGTVGQAKRPRRDGRRQGGGQGGGGGAMGVAGQRQWDSFAESTANSCYNV
jgi:hypothetical protein